MAVTMERPVSGDSAGSERYAALEERILARDQVGTGQEFYGLVKEGRPLAELVRETVRIHAPYTHVPFHQRQDSGDVRFVNNDHALLSMRAALRLMPMVPRDLTYLPLAQTLWYIPSSLDPWNQLLGRAPGHYMRMYTIKIDKPLPPEIHWQDQEPVYEPGTYQERLDGWLTLVQTSQVEQAYRVFLGLLEDEPNRERLLAHLMFAGLIDVQDRTLFRTSYTTGHKSYRARATIELGRTVGWENAHSVVYAGALDMAVGPHWYSMYEMACNFSRAVLQGADVEMRHNKGRLTRAETAATLDVILHGDELAVVRQITVLLKAGKAMRQIVDTIQIAAAEVILQCGSAAAYNMPMHAYEYCNTLRWFYDNFDHPHQVKLLYVCASFVNEVCQGQRAFPGNEPRKIRRPRGIDAVPQQQLLERIDQAIIGLQPDESVGLTSAYLRGSFDREPLVAVLAAACSKFGNDPHNQEISLCLLEDYLRSTSPDRDRLLLAAASHASGHRKYGDALESYRRFSEAFGLSTRQEAQGDASPEEALLDD